MLQTLKKTIQNKLNADDRLKEVIEKGTIAFVFKILGVIMFFLFNMSVTYFVNTEAWGIFSLFYPVVNIVSIIAIFGCDTAMVRFMSEYFSTGQTAKAKGIYLQILKMVLLFAFSFSILLFFLSPLLAWYFKNNNLQNIFYIGSFCVLPMTITALHSEALRGIKKIKEFSYVQQGTQFGLALLFFVCYAIFKIPVNSIPVIAFIISMWLIAAWSIYLFRKHSGFKYTQVGTSDYGSLKLIEWVFPMFLSGFLQIVMSWTDILILGHYVTADKVGIYRTSLQIAGSTSMALFAINTIVAPKFSELYTKNDMQGLSMVVRNTSRLMFILSVPVMLLIFLFPRIILSIFGSDYTVDEAVYTLFILTISQLFNVGFGSVLILLNMTGKQKIVQNIVIVATIINISLCILLIPYWGIIGAAIANAINMLIWNTIAALYIKKHYNIWTIAFLQ